MFAVSLHWVGAVPLLLTESPNRSDSLICGIGIQKNAKNTQRGRNKRGTILISDRGSCLFGGAMLWRSCKLVTLLGSAVAKNAPAKPVECAITKLLDLKSFRICSYKKCGGGEYQRCVLRPTGRRAICGAGNRRPGGVAAEIGRLSSGRSGICSRLI